MEIVGGPNGAGKTTFAELIFQHKRPFHFINADVIASGLGTPEAPRTAIASSRLMLRQIRRNLAEGSSFAFESTLAGRMWSRVIEEAHGTGYSVIIYFVVVRDVDMALARIAARVAVGGHDIPPELATRRFGRSILMFRDTYGPLCDQWYLFDNSGSAAVLVAKKESHEIRILNEETYRRVILDA